MQMKLSTWHFHAVWFWTLLAPIPLLYWNRLTKSNFWKKEFTSLYLHRSQPINWRTPGQGLKAETCTRNHIGTLITSSLSDLMTHLGSASFLSRSRITCLRLIPLRVFWALLYQLVMKSIPTDRPNWLRQCFNWSSPVRILWTGGKLINKATEDKYQSAD